MKLLDGQASHTHHDRARTLGVPMSIESLRWLILGLLFFSTVINYVDRQALSVLLPTLREELGLSSADYGLITTVFLTAYTIAQIPIGMWIDKVGTRVGLAVLVGAWSVAAMLHALARGPISLCGMRCLLGLTEAGNWPGGAKAVAMWFPQKRRALAMAVFDSGSALGAVLAPPCVALLAIYMGWRAAFVITGVLGIVWLVAWLAIYHVPRTHPWLASGDRDKVLEEVGNSNGKSAAGFKVPLRRIIGTRALWGLMATRMVATPAWWFYVFWLPDYLSKGRGFSLTEIGFYGWIPYFTVDLGKVTGGAISDRLLSRGHSATLARKSVMACGALAMMGGLFVVSAPNAAVAIAWVSVATFGFGLWSANILALHADIFPAQIMGTVMGATTMAASLGGAIFTYGVGLVVDSVGYAPVFAVVGLLAATACGLLVFAVGRVERMADEPAPLTS